MKTNKIEEQEQKIIDVSYTSASTEISNTDKDKPVAERINKMAEHFRDMQQRIEELTQEIRWKLNKS